MNPEACAAEIVSAVGHHLALEQLEVERIITKHLQGETLFRLAPGKFIERRDDMSTDDTLRLLMERDGDLILSLVKFEEGQVSFPSVQFCTVGSGGGRSLQTRRALFALAEAIAIDNREEPSAKGNHDQSHTCFGGSEK